jgi:hypothetical protein
MLNHLPGCVNNVNACFVLMEGEIYALIVWSSGGGLRK